MRAQGALVAMILAIASYFTLIWGFDALRILTSPTFGLDDVWRSQIVFGLGRFIGLAPEGLLQLSAAFGAVKLVVAGVCTVHILDRARAMMTGGSADPAILEAGLLLVVAITLVSAAPALWTSNVDLLRELFIQLVLAALAAGLLVFERSSRAKQAAAATPDEDDILELGVAPMRGRH